jgi:hypothetical protein
VGERIDALGETLVVKLTQPVADAVGSLLLEQLTPKIQELIAAGTEERFRGVDELLKRFEGRQSQMEEFLRQLDERVRILEQRIQ